MFIRFLDDKYFRYSVILGAWLAWCLVRLAEAYLLTPDPGTIQWSEQWVRQLLAGLGWFLATPVILWVTDRFWFNRQLLKAISIHLFTCLVLLILRAFLQAGALTLLYGTDANPVFHDDFVSLGIFFSRAWAFGTLIQYAVIASSYSALLWFREYKKAELERAELLLQSERLQKQLSEAKLMALRMQLNPHFLFNTLHSVASLIRFQEQEKAIHTLSVLSQMLRYTIYEGTHHFATVGEEMRFLNNYLAIEKLRFAERLHITVDVAESLNDYVIPSFLLQPIVENSIKHGLKNVDRGELKIMACTAADTIKFVVTDNGIGLPPGWKMEDQKGIGLKNTLARLNAFFSDQYKFSIAPRTQHQGTEVTIVLPKQLNGHERV